MVARSAKTPEIQRTPDQRQMIVRKDPEALTIVIEKGHPLYQRRAHNDPPAWMVASALEHGIFTPIIVRKGPIVGGVQTWDVVCGRMRVKSARKANEMRRADGKMGMTIPCIEFKGTDEEAVRLMAAENEHRIATDPMTRAETAAQEMRFGASEAKVMNDNVWTRATFEAHMALLRVTPRVQAAVQEGRLQLAAVAAIAKLTRSEHDDELERLLSAGKVGPREVANAVDAAHPDSVEKPAVAKPARAKPLRSRKVVEAKLAELDKALTADVGRGVARHLTAKTAGMVRALKWVLGEADTLEAGQG